MRILNRLKKMIYIFAFNLLKEESYEEDLRRNFSFKYTGIPPKKREYF